MLIKRACLLLIMIAICTQLHSKATEPWSRVTESTLHGEWQGVTSDYQYVAVFLADKGGVGILALVGEAQDAAYVFPVSASSGPENGIRLHGTDDSKAASFDGVLFGNATASKGIVKLEGAIRPSRGNYGIDTQCTITLEKSESDLVSRLQRQMQLARELTRRARGPMTSPQQQ